MEDDTQSENASQAVLGEVRHHADPCGPSQQREGP